MTTALLVLFGSVIVGLATGFLFRVWALLVVSPAIATVAAIVLQASDFGLWTGVPIVVCSLIFSQLAYMVAAVQMHKAELSVQDDVDGDPSQHRQHGVGEYDE